MRQILICVLTMLLTFALGVAIHPIKSKDKRISVANRENEEYAVYSALINRRRAYDDGRVLLIGKQTFSSYPHDVNKTDELVFIKLYIPDSTSRDVLEDYKSQNQQSSELTSFFRLHNRYVLISGPERYFENQKSRLAFNTEYPNSTGGITLFSQVGFNSEMDQALVYASKYCGGLCGGGGYYLLSKKEWDLDIGRPEDLDFLIDGDLFRSGVLEFYDAAEQPI